MKPLHERMLDAAETLTEVSALYGYHYAERIPWSPAELRTEAPHVEADTRG